MISFYGALSGHSPYLPGQMMPRNAPSGTSTKLRNSCHSCAVSKVKCPKEKPTCSKCESRGIPCHYFLARRPGRRVDRSKSLRLASDNDLGLIETAFSPTDSVTGFPGGLNAISLEQPSPLACFFPPETPTSRQSLSRRASYLDSSLGLDLSASPNGDHAFFSTSNDVFSLLDRPATIPNLPEFEPATSDIDAAMSVMDYPFDMPSLSGADMTQTHSDISSILLPSSILAPDLLSCEASPILDSLSPCSREESLAAQSRSASNRNSVMTHSSSYSTSCGCLAQALELLNSTSTTVSQSLTAHQSPEASIASIQTIMNENRNSIAIVGSRLACASCIGDSSLLAILFMIVLRILERYASAALAQPPWARGLVSSTSGAAAAAATSSLPSSSRRPLKVRSHSIPIICDQRKRSVHHFQPSMSDGVSNQAASQLVLSELFRVQLLIDQLSMRLGSPADGSVRVMDIDFGIWPEHQMAGDSPDATMAAFSASTLVQMERDVRQSLNLLSAEIINNLQKN